MSSLNKKFTSGLFHQGGMRENPFQLTWAPLSPGAKAFESHPGLKEIEAKLLKETKEKIFLIEKEAYEKGFEQGQRDGQELGLKRLEGVIHQLNHVLCKIEAQRKNLSQAYEKQMLQMVFVIGEKIIRHELQFREDVIVDVLREAFRCVKDRRKVSIRLHPADYRYLTAHPEKLPFPLDEKEGVRLVDDPSISRGGCFLNTSFGEVDATFESQLDEIISIVWKEMEEAGRLSHP